MYVEIYTQQELQMQVSRHLSDSFGQGTIWALKIDFKWTKEQLYWTFPSANKNASILEL